MSDVTELNRLLLSAVAQNAITFADLWPVANRLLGHPKPTDSDGPGYRAADRFLQGARKKGYVSYRRIGRATLWSITPAGRKALAEAGERNA